MRNITALRQRKIELNKKQRELLDKAATEERNLNEAEAALYDDNIKALVANQEQLDREIRAMEFERAEKGMPVGDDDNPNPNPEAKAAKPFKSFGEQLVAVVQASMGNARNTDSRLIRAAASGTSEAVPSDGGFLVQTDFSAELLQRTYEAGQIANRVARIPIGANSNGVKINAIDEDSRANGARWGGIQAFWANEADAFTASKPKFRQIELKLQKLIGLCYATDELLMDAAALEAVVMQAFPQEFTFKVEDGIINGTGSGQPLGLLNSGAVIVVNKDSGQATGTVSTSNVLNMWSQCWGRSRQNAAWLIDQSVEPQLYPLTLGSGTAVQLLYTPPGVNGNNGQYGLLLGRPVIPVEHCAALSSQGDIILADLSQYIMADKGAPQAASSIHVRFLNDETTFRFVYRVDGQPTWKKPLTPKSGGPVLSPFVTLQAR